MPTAISGWHPPGRWCSSSSSGFRSSPRPANNSRACGWRLSLSSARWALIGFRLALAQLVRQWMRDGRLERRTVVVGADEEGEALIRALDSQRDAGLRVLGVFDDRGDDRAG